jgi:hypothetical protein
LAVSGYNQKDHWALRAPTSPVELAASNRVALLMLCEKLFTVAEYNQLCTDIGSGKVEFRMYEDGIVFTRKF